jgi:hypothetical protein
MSNIAGVSFLLSCPADLVPRLQNYLSHYTCMTAERSPVAADLPYHLDVHVGDDALRSMIDEFAPHMTTGLIEPIHGVLLTERTDADRRRCYTVRADAIEGRAGSWAATVRGHEIALYCRHQDDAPRHALRLIREVVLRAHENRGGLVFHAAGLVLAGGVGAMICGAGASGKTTTLTAMLSAGGRALLAGDRLILRRAGDVDALVAVPLPVKAARGTIESCPALQAAAGRHLSRPQPGPLASLPGDFGTQVKVEFSAHEYAEAMGVNLAGGAQLGRLIVSRFADSAQSPQLRRLSEAETRAHLVASCFTPAEEFWVRPWLVQRESSLESLQAHADRVCADVASRVPATEVRFGVRAPADRFQALMDDLLGAICDRVS